MNSSFSLLVFKSSLRVSLHKLFLLKVFRVLILISGSLSLGSAQIQNIEPGDTLYGCLGGLTTFNVLYSDPNVYSCQEVYVSAIGAWGWIPASNISCSNPAGELLEVEQVGTFPITLAIETHGYDAIGNFIVSNTTANITLIVYDNNLSATLIDANCGQANGSIDLSFTAGSPFTFQWSNGATTEDIQSLAVGTYDITIYDSKYCRLNKSYIVYDSTIISPNLSHICPGSSVQLSINSSTNTTFTWQNSSDNGLNWANINGYVDTSLTTYISPPLTDTMQYRVISDYANCNTIKTSAVVTVNVSNPVLAALTSSNDNFCQGKTAVLQAQVLGGIPYTNTYTWYEKVNNAWVNVQNSGSSYNISPLIDTDYRVQVNSTGANCSMVGSGTDSILITVRPKPTVTVNPAIATVICPNDVVTITASGANTYTWTPNTYLNATTGASVICLPTINGSTTYSVIGTALSGCTDTAQTIISKTNSPTATIIQKTPQLCEGIPAVFTLTAPSYNGYTNPTFQWKKNGVAIAGAIDTSFTSNSLSNGDVILCEVTTNQACAPIIISNSITVALVSGIAVPTLVINNNPCFKSPFTTTATYAGANPTYTWKKNGVIIAGQTTGTLTLNSFFPLSQGDSITCEMVSSMTCAIHPTVSQPLIKPNVNNLICYSISDATNLKEACMGDTITITGHGGYCADCGCFYANANSIHYTPASVSMYSTEVIGSGPIGTPNDYCLLEPCLFGQGSCATCSISLSGYPTVYGANFTPTITISQNNIISDCSSNILVFSATAYGKGDVGTYQWKINGQNAPLGTNQQFASATLQSGDIVTCTMTSSLSCAAVPTVTSNAITVILPNTLSSPTPTICSGGTVTLTFNGGIGTSAYTWQQSTNGGASWYGVTGTTATTTSITTGAMTASRLFRVIYNSTVCGNGLITPIFTLNVIPDPTVTVTASNNNFCAGGNTTLSANLNGGVGAGTYQWQQYIGTTWTDIAGATNQTYTTSALSANTNYKVISSQTGAGCMATGTNSFNVLVKPLPNIYTNPDSATIINGNSVTLNAYNGTSYSWSPATGLNTTTGSTVIANPTTTTIYTVTGLGTNGCSKTINVPVVVNYATAEEEEHLQHFALYPNPAHTKLSILLKTSSEQILRFTVYDLLGRIISQWQDKTENGIYEQEISIENLSQGVYFLSAKVGESVMTQKFVKE